MDYFINKFASFMLIARIEINTHSVINVCKCMNNDYNRDNGFMESSSGLLTTHPHSPVRTCVDGLHDIVE